MFPKEIYTIPEFVEYVVEESGEILKVNCRIDVKTGERIDIV